MVDKIQNGTTTDAVSKSTKLLCKVNKSCTFLLWEFLQVIPTISKLAAMDVTPVIVRIVTNGTDSSREIFNGPVASVILWNFRYHQPSVSLALLLVKTQRNNHCALIFFYSVFILTNQLTGVSWSSSRWDNVVERWNVLWLARQVSCYDNTAGVFKIQLDLVALTKLRKRSKYQKNWIEISLEQVLKLDLWSIFFLSWCIKVEMESEICYPNRTVIQP